MIRLPRQSSAFPRNTATEIKANAWGSQWKQLRAPATLLRNATRDTLRTLRS
ncbi:hypothetical protein [Novosphingobium sp. MMS21-SN21R]|uniref:hypothetical protein n=1 Tax=Novosphingobium sp. MMS21-SN21R TaxID=2969298 RepID=UPI0028837549|nr:hypothetical protein [Novosphingobium sp. MMS21-SN21R]MDT0506504.1 hypothetical protein [Novosphingobium sp. MMS21-SN21R]